MRKQKVTAEQIRALCGGLDIPLNDAGRVELPEEAEQADYVRTIFALMSLDRDITVFSRFSIGNLVLRTPGLEHGMKKAFCVKMFGEQLGANAMNYQWVARAWPNHQDIGWGWTWYRVLKKLPHPVKMAYVQRWKGGLKYKKMCEEVKELLKPTPKITAVIFEYPHKYPAIDKPDSTGIESSVYVESASSAEQYARCCSDLQAIQLIAILSSRWPEPESEEDTFAEE